MHACHRRCRTACRGRSPRHRARQPVECLQLGREGEPVLEPRHEQGLDAERIACRDDALGRRQHEREHAVQPRDPARLRGAVQVQDGLAVALRREGGLAQDRAQVGVVVDLAIGHQHVVGAVDRLHAVVGADDREPAMRHQGRHAGRPADLHVVRAAMRDLRDHAARKLGLVDLPEADKSAHALFRPSWPASPLPQDILA